MKTSGQQKSGSRPTIAVGRVTRTGADHAERERKLRRQGRVRDRGSERRRRGAADAVATIDRPPNLEDRDMNSQRSSLGHRVALGGIVTSALMTQLAFGQTAQDPAPSQDETSMKISIEFNEARMTATLYDNPSARDFASMLPLDFTIDDYSKQ
jgi:Cyclophilin-like family